MAPRNDPQINETPAGTNRRRFLSAASTLMMTGGLAAGYGTFIALAGRFLYPAQARALAWILVGQVDRLQVGQSLQYRSPAGEAISVTRRGATGTAEDFLALSSTCPHLGCQVHWEPQNNRFFCPCHNGVFDPSGKATAGPPADAGQSLPRYSLRVEDGLLFIEVPVDSLSNRRQA